MDIESHVARNADIAEEIAAELRAERDPQRFYRALKRYVRTRYLLEDDPYWDDDIAAYTRYSIRKTIERSDDPARLGDLGVNCAGSSSAVTKHLLLIMSLRKSLGVDLDPDDVACAATVQDLATLLLAALQKSKL